MTTWEQLRDAAAVLGHEDLVVTPTKSGRRWAVMCYGCGWGREDDLGRPTVTAATEVEAIKRLRHHIERAVQDEIRRQVQNGQPVTLGDQSGRRVG